MLDPTRLEKLRHRGNKSHARCPACAEQDRDRTGNHLVLFADGKFACAAHPGDAEHRKRIFALAGLPDSLPPRDRPASSSSILRLTSSSLASSLRAADQARAAAAIRQRRAALIAAHPWDPYDVWETSPQRPDDPLVLHDPRHFLRTLFPPEALLWTGEVHESGDKHARRWRTRAEWCAAPDDERIGPMTTPTLWAPGTVSRSTMNVVASPYTVLDFDGFDGLAPVTEEEHHRHLRDSLALLRWLQDECGMRLAAIVHTGGKSLHAWIETPPPEALASLKTHAPLLGLDPGLLGHPEHPCRLPGHCHPKTGRVGEVVWLREAEG
ncbi:hypothetical protein [Luteolibacter sp. LG18]|uniref:hypothetical protein n=1 Tax=Luteolibacter sp. LG18 TaxID=2819286 RepID=UPI002B2AFE52|nr:hypothetical protein llg_38010 [Luteolibacter sp. LG18]